MFFSLPKYVSFLFLLKKDAYLFKLLKIKTLDVVKKMWSINNWRVCLCNISTSVIMIAHNISHLDAMLSLSLDVH